MMLDADKMVAAASSRNPTLVGALTRLQRCAFSGSWEVRIMVAQALITITVRLGEPFRLQMYEFLHVLAQARMQAKFTDTQLSNGEDQGTSGTGLSSIISPMLRVLDEMYKGQDELIKDMRNHDNNKQEWTDDELQKLYETQLLPKEFQISFMTVKWHELNLHQSAMKPQLPSVKEGMTSYQTISNGSTSWQRCLAVAE